MVEGPSKKDPSVVTTRTRGNKPLHVAAELEPGSYHRVVVRRAAPHHLLGSLVS